jgi:hypothetical protein
MMCHKIGMPPMVTIGFGFTPVSSLRRVPNPPAKMTAFMHSLPHQSLRFSDLSNNLIK